jgi:hypothetical protein
MFLLGDTALLEVNYVGQLIWWMSVEKKQKTITNPRNPE